MFKPKGPTKAIKAAILGVPYTIQFNGDTNFNYVVDLAEVFVRCALVPKKGAFRFNIGGEPMHAKVRSLFPNFCRPFGIWEVFR